MHPPGPDSPSALVTGYILERHAMPEMSIK
jgi:hypothetical protein